MFIVDWDTLTEDDLKDTDFLVKEFRKFLKKDCKYSYEEAKWVCDVISEPFARNYKACDKKPQGTRKINSKMYEVFFCYVEDTAPFPFEFYTLVDVETKTEPYYGDKLLPYIDATKKFVFPKIKKGRR